MVITLPEVLDALMIFQLLGILPRCATLVQIQALQS